MSQDSEESLSIVTPSTHAKIKEVLKDTFGVDVEEFRDWLTSANLKEIHGEVFLLGYEIGKKTGDSTWDRLPQETRKKATKWLVDLTLEGNN